MQKRRGALLGLIVVALLGLSSAARADHATEMKAREDFAAGRYDDALELFAKLYAETLNPVYLRNIGRCHQKLRHPDKAIDAFKDYLAKGKKISSDERAEINGYIKEMQDLRDQQAQQQQPPAAAAPVAAAAAPPPPEAPPAPVQPLPAPGAEPAGAYPPGAYPPAAYPGAGGPTGQPQPAGTLVAQPGPAPEAQPAPVYTRWWFWTIIGAAVVGGVVTAVVLSSGTDRPACSAPGVTGLVCK